MEIPIGGEFTEQDVKRAISLGYPTWYQPFRIDLTLLMAWPLLYGLVPSIQSIAEGDVPPGPALLLLLPLLLVVLVLAAFVYALWVLPLRQARRIQDTPLCQGTFSGVASDESFVLGNEAAASSVRWDSFVQYRMSDDMVLLYQNKNAYSMVPRSFFANDSDWQNFRDHIRATVPKKAK